MVEWRLVWISRSTPPSSRSFTLETSIRMMTASAVEAPVTMLRVYCSWPGVSAMMNLRFGVAK
jgi:hypothetical protein